MYNEFFGFSENPFSVSPQPHFLFLAESHKEALASLLYGVAERKGFLSLTGELGIGKTTLILHTINQLRGKKIHCVFVPVAPSNIEELLKEILRPLNLLPEDGDKVSFIRRLNDFLLEGLPRDENLALFIDEAQDLGQELMEELRLLSNLETSTSKLIQIVLAGTPELAGKLSSPDLRQLKQRIVIRRDIRPLDAEDSREYVEHRLKLVGSDIYRIFEAGAADLICQQSRGIPFNINRLSEKSLQIAFGLGSKRIDLPIVRQAIKDIRALPAKEKEPFSQQMLPQEEKPPIIPSAPITPEPQMGRGNASGNRSRYTKPAFFVIGLACVLIVLFLGPRFQKNSQEKMEPVVPKSASPKSDAVAVMIQPKPEPAPAPKAESATPPSSAEGPGKPQEAPPPQTARAPQPVSVSPAPPEKESEIKGVVTVQKGDTLSFLSQKYYGFTNTTLLDKILESNPAISNLHLITVDEKFRFPAITDSSLISRAAGGTWKIHLGTFPRAQSADAYRTEPLLKGRTIEVVARKVSPDQTWYRIFAGKFTGRKECLKTVSSLREKGVLPAFPRKR